MRQVVRDSFSDSSCQLQFRIKSRRCSSHLMDGPSSLGEDGDTCLSPSLQDHGVPGAVFPSCLFLGFD